MTTLLLALGFFAVALPVIFVLTMHLGFKAPRIAHNKNPSDHGLSFKQVDIPIKQNRKLFAWHLLASHHPSTPTILIMHGWGANAQMMLPLAEPFYHAGMNCLLLEARNHGHSPNDGISSLPQFAKDIDTAIDWLKKNKPAQTGPLVLLGHSVGAAAVLLVASRRSDIDAVISLSGFAHPRWLMQRHLHRPQKSLFFLLYLAPLVMGYAQWIIGHRFDDIAPMNTLCSIKCPVLLVHGTLDKTIPLADMYAIAGNCPDKHPEVLLIEGAGHDAIDKIKQHTNDILRFLKRSGIGPVKEPVNR
jgi:pimeloyl-ACP methyl ester carboxylesterase